MAKPNDSVLHIAIHMQRSALSEMKLRSENPDSCLLTMRAFTVNALCEEIIRLHKATPPASASKTDEEK